STRMQIAQWPPRSSSIPKCSGPACATRWRRCSSIATWWPMEPGGRLPIDWCARRRLSFVWILRRRPRSPGREVPTGSPAPADWDTEFLSLTLAVRSVASLDEALSHIAEHGTRHTASIVTKNKDHAERFLREVDASCVLWNASTRFNDGGELGLGAEMGIST